MSGWWLETKRRCKDAPKVFTCNGGSGAWTLNHTGAPMFWQKTPMVWHISIIYSDTKLIDVAFDQLREIQRQKTGYKP